MPLFTELGSFFRASLLDPAHERAAEDPRVLRRRRIVVALTLVLGGAALGLALAIRPGDPWFYPATLGVAALWVLGAVASGPLHLGRARTRAGGQSSSVLQALILGGMLLAVFLAGAVVVGRIDWLRGPITPRWRVVGSAALYALATVATGVPLLVLAATALGLLTGLQRRVTGGVLGPIVTHLTWSLGMLFALPWALDLWS